MDEPWKRKKKKYIVNKLQIDEISAVDRPAQEHAKVVLMKREFSQEERERLSSTGAAMSDGSYPIQNGSDLKDAIQAFGRAKDKAATAMHIKARATALGMTNTLPDSGELASMLNKSAIGGTEQKETAMSDDNLAKVMAEKETLASDLAKSTAKQELMSVELKKYKALSSMSPDHRIFYQNMEDSDKDGFMAKSFAGRETELELAKSADPVVYTADDGTEFRKSHNGQLVKMQKKIDENERALRKSQEQNESLMLQKRAETDLCNLGGDVDTHIEMLKALDTISDDGARTKALDLLKGQNAAYAKSFESAGTSSIPSDTFQKHTKESAIDELQRLAKAHAEKENMDYFDAYEIVSKSQDGNELMKRATTTTQ